MSYDHTTMRYENSVLENLSGLFTQTHQYTKEDIVYRMDSFDGITAFEITEVLPIGKKWYYRGSSLKNPRDIRSFNHLSVFSSRKEAIEKSILFLQGVQ